MLLSDAVCFFADLVADEATFSKYLIIILIVVINRICKLDLILIMILLVRLT